ncbi:thioredoxin family protein [Polaribacter gangjinensis]|uniref:Thioredoxin family protein n=1 Tax=Polaribacter gangjinensis TaxID=574710 RepID=A0A2S7WAA7_9FLAO|nr:thioredoxin family protein [Polaribacter gangjinensis]PQJ74211.1 thioredoxin family protein [Polaribacter gangjinensis]
MKTFQKIVLCFVVFLIATAFTKSTENGYKVGDTIEDFSLKNVDGKMVSLSDYKKAKGFIIIFTCNMCPYSVANEDRINALDAKYKSKGFPVIAINPNDPKASKGDGFEDMIVRAKEKSFSFPYLFDEGQKVYPKFGASKTPHVFIVNKKGMKVEYIGAIDNSSKNPDAVTEKYVENAVDALLAGKKIEKTETRAIGCTIKVL